MKSRVIFSSVVIKEIRKIAHEVSDDKISVYAAQASFFVITSAVPFISIMFALFGIFMPDSIASAAQEGITSLPVSKALSEIIGYIAGELNGAPNISLLSISAVTTLWSASRGISAVRSGIESVYKADIGRNIVAKRLKSILATVIFIAMLAAICVVLLFGNFAADLLGEGARKIFYSARIPIFVLIMTFLFTAAYFSVARRSTHVSRKISRHISGALISSVGWVLFSYIYSLYIENFPGASYIYGGLAAICLIMLWIYFCMMILLFGAVINKLYFASDTKTHAK